MKGRVFNLAYALGLHRRTSSLMLQSTFSLSYEKQQIQIRRATLAFRAIRNPEVVGSVRAPNPGVGGAGVPPLYIPAEMRRDAVRHTG